MARCIVKIKDSYFEWSTVADAPVTYAMTRSNMIRHLMRSDGNQDRVQERMYRVDENGHSALWTSCALDEFIAGNRAGPDESCLSVDEIYERYKSEEAYEGAKQPD